MNRYVATLCTLVALAPLEAQALDGAGFCEINRPVTHKVIKGDILVSIALNYYQDRSRATEIAKYNKLRDQNNIYAGQILELPGKFTKDYLAHGVKEQCP